ncbi:hypothetical protein CALCODRAFT_195721 [Calocera cornea HHB12733]|uniref:Uncharacterized protein n=1 Tax=Calocera cornea HHB12733 TaxID=1353952 RepID=A0A165HJK0_9BASI|nr:hypothetical protein CALCODRAFT_195721 [Calocera cornea HHB12733]
MLGSAGRVLKTYFNGGLSSDSFDAFNDKPNGDFNGEVNGDVDDGSNTHRHCQRKVPCQLQGQFQVIRPPFSRTVPGAFPMPLPLAQPSKPQVPTTVLTRKGHTN